MSVVVAHTLYPAVFLGFADRMGLVPSVNTNQKDMVCPAGMVSGELSAGSAARPLVVVTLAVSRVVQVAVRMLLLVVP